MCTKLQEQVFILKINCDIMSNSDDDPLEKTLQLYGTGFTGRFSDRLTRRYVSLLAVSLGLTVGQMSILRAIQSLGRNILQPVWGRLSDKYGKKRFIALGRSLYGVFLLGLLFFQTPWWIIILSAGTGVWWSIIRPNWTSLLGDYTEKESRGTSIGDINSISQIGGIIAMIIAFIIGWINRGEITPSSYRPIIIMAAIFSMISGLLSLFTKQKPPRTDDEPFDIEPILNDLTLRRYLVVNSLFGLSVSLAWPLFPFIIGDKLDLNIWQVAL